MQIVVQILVMIGLARIARDYKVYFVPQVAESLPQICFLSGLGGEEMKMFIEAFPETGLEPAVFAALVPNSADKPLQELIEEVMGHHEMLIHLEAWKLT
ncbi:hypothetical protein KPL71_017357 [Citrus sinensis]|uniref:Uncharacterized protein n=1 Tax=Citrus sinensis TaxID=2711 RepID=A0ACB8JRK5_CITSI|nr:hypothetical protein KPL71_017357 [Citrus sinensis]